MTGPGDAVPSLVININGDLDEATLETLREKFREAWRTQWPTVLMPAITHARRPVMTDQPSLSAQFAASLRERIATHRLDRWGRPGRAARSEFVRAVTEDARKWAEAATADARAALLRAHDDHAATVRQLAGEQARAAAYAKRIAGYERTEELAADRLNEAEARVTELEDTHGRLRAEVAGLREKLAATERAAMAEAELTVPDGQGAAPEPPPVAPLPVRKPRTRKPGGGAQ